MSEANNKGYDPSTIQAYQARIKSSGNNYVLDEEEEQGEEYAHFYFVGNHEGRDVIFDTVIYTLRMNHESELYEIAEERASKQFPKLKRISELDDNDPLQEEVGMFMAEVILELEEEEAVKVKEHVDQDLTADFGIGLDVGLNVDQVTHDVITKFIGDFNNDRLQLDDALYSFQTDDQDED